MVNNRIWIIGVNRRTFYGHDLGCPDCPINSARVRFRCQLLKRAIININRALQCFACRRVIALFVTGDRDDLEAHQFGRVTGFVLPVLAPRAQEVRAARDGVGDFVGDRRKEFARKECVPVLTSGAAPSGGWPGGGKIAWWLVGCLLRERRVVEQCFQSLPALRLTACTSMLRNYGYCRGWRAFRCSLADVDERALVYAGPA